MNGDDGIIRVVCGLGGDCEHYHNGDCSERCATCGHNKYMDSKEEPKKPAETLEKNVNHPARYTKGKVECIDAIDSAVIGKPPDEAVCVANVIKYLWRYEEKEPLRSAMSAAWYLDRLIGKLKAKEAK